MIKDVDRYFTAEQAIDGEYVPVYRAFGFDQVQYVDPFLLLDYFTCKEEIKTNDFPWHPHRGIETLTYLKKGKFSHNDSLGNKIILSEGDLQWTKAGKGIMHQEIPHLDKEIQGFQLWVNIDSSNKLSKPEYKNLSKGDYPVFIDPSIEVNILMGEYMGMRSPLKSNNTKLLDVKLIEGNTFEIDVHENDNIVLFLYEGCIDIKDKHYCPYSTITFSKGKKVVVEAKETVQFLFMSGVPLNEQIAWRGSIVMNTRYQVQKAYQQLENGTFTK